MGSKIQKVSAFVAKLVPAVQKAEEVGSKADELLGQRDALLKFSKADEKEREKLVREIAGIDSHFDDAIAATRTVRDNLEAIQMAVEWPLDAEGGDLFAAGCEAADKHGKGSNQAKAAWTAYGKHLYVFGDAAEDICIKLKDAKAEVPKRQKASKALVEVTSKIEGILAAALKLPVPTTIQATLFAASEDAGLLRSQAQVIDSLLGGIAKQIATAIKEGDEIVVQNAKWLAWTAKAADKDVQELRRSAKSKLPR